MHAQDQVKYIDPVASVTLIDVMGTDARVVNAARVSYNKWINEEQPINQKDTNLIGYLAEHEHDSPFFHPVVCFRIKMPLFVAREWFRHTVGFARNEVSRRYVDGPVECFMPEVVRARNPDVKQGSASAPVANEIFSRSMMQNAMSFSVMVYRQLLDEGVCPELARTVLPQSMMTEFIETASLRAYARLCGQRNSPNAQYEIRCYAQAIDALLRNKFPVSWAALTK